MIELHELIQSTTQSESCPSFVKVKQFFVKFEIVCSCLVIKDEVTFIITLYKKTKHETEIDFIQIKSISNNIEGNSHAYLLEIYLVF